ncbi:MAG: helix-turn-helix domain-containing protein, partial [Kiritimatiellales bacterium]|nr:helix-turn-helix domain-containing protein [Kiritimatiellales bacterium]
MIQQTSLNIGTIGQKLEAARQAKGVSVSEAGRATKILSKFIEAMEADDFGVLSAPVYAKSFIKMYAQYLGLDARPLVDEYAEQHAPKAKRPLPDEVKVNLAKADLAVGEPTTPPRRLEGKSIFGG